MISDSEKSFKEGYLLFPPHGVLGQLKKSWQKKYCQLFRASKHGIERLEIFDNEEDAGKTFPSPIVTLENCIKITQVKDAQKQQPHVFAVVTKSVVHHLAANSETEMLDWISALQAVAFKDNVSRQTIEEDNDLYCSSGDAGIFSIMLVSSEASERCGLTPGPYTLVVTPSALQLRDVTEQSILFTWPYRFIRRYGYRAGKFTFEAGRKCESGEGTFHMEHSNQQEIFRCISSKMKNMRKLLTGESLPAIICGDNQFNAALSMTARSRSPLPPSPTSATTPLLDSDLCTISSVKPLMPLVSDSFESLNSAPRTVNVLPLKPKPQKPPRKNIPAKPVPPAKSQLSQPPSVEFKRSDSDHDSSTYDDVEVRSEAWRTMGVDILTHTERPFCRDDAGKVFIQQALTCNDYDRLQHLGPMSKANPGAGYKQINAIATVTSTPMSMLPDHTTVTIDRDDEIQAVRMADDSHLGYGMIRKKSVPLDSSHLHHQTHHEPKHTVHNEMEYAVICKPNRV